jgi:hypothetical protein
MKYGKKIFLLVILVTVFFTIYIRIEAGNNLNINYVKVVKGYSVNKEFFNKMSNFHHGVFTKKGIKYDSSIKGLSATIFNQEKPKKSFIYVTWNNCTKTLNFNSFISDICWRPGTTNFIFIQDDETKIDEDEGDFGQCKLNYVTLMLTDNRISTKNIDFGSSQIGTSIEWSNDGRYFVYSEASSLRINDFDTGQIWASKEIYFENDKVRIIPNSSSMLGYFTWIENDKKILFLWKHHPYDDAPSGYGVVNVEQFGIR